MALCREYSLETVALTAVPKLLRRSRELWHQCGSETRVSLATGNKIKVVACFILACLLDFQAKENEDHGEAVISCLNTQNNLDKI